MRKIIFIISVCLLLMPLSLIAQEKIIVGGTGACQTLVKALADDFMLKNKGAIIEVPDSIGSGGGIKAVAKGAINIARVARKLNESEKDLTYKAFALSPVVFGTKSDVGVANLSSADILKIYSGEITNWKQLGGKELKIYVISREKDDSSISVLNDLLKGFKELVFSKDLITALKDQEMIDTLKGKEGTIGFGTLSNFKKAGIKIFSVDSAEPTLANVGSGKYKLISEFAFVYKELSGLSKKFIDFVFSADGKKIITNDQCVAK